MPASSLTRDMGLMPFARNLHSLGFGRKETPHILQKAIASNLEAFRKAGFNNAGDFIANPEGVRQAFAEHTTVARTSATLVTFIQRLKEAQSQTTGNFIFGKPSRTELIAVLQPNTPIASICEVLGGGEHRTQADFSVVQERLTGAGCKIMDDVLDLPVRQVMQIVNEDVSPACRALFLEITAAASQKFSGR